MSGDYEERPDGKIRLVEPATCGNGHKVASRGWGKCPRCKMMTTVFYCEDLRCTGKRASDQHTGTECDIYLQENQHRPGWGRN